MSFTLKNKIRSGEKEKQFFDNFYGDFNFKITYDYKLNFELTKIEVLIFRIHTHTKKISYQLIKRIFFFKL